MTSVVEAAGPATVNEFAEVARALAQHEWGVDNAGNLSVRLGDGSVVVTGAGTTMAQVAEDPAGTLVLVDAEGAKLAGAYAPSSELLAHLLTYDAVRDSRPWIAALGAYACAEPACVGVASAASGASA